MDSIEEKYEQEIADLRAEVDRLLIVLGQAGDRNNTLKADVEYYKGMKEVVTARTSDLEEEIVALKVEIAALKETKEN